MLWTDKTDRNNVTLRKKTRFDKKRALQSNNIIGSIAVQLSVPFDRFLGEAQTLEQRDQRLGGLAAAREL